MMYLLSHILDESSQRFPDKEAMRFNGQAMTYGDWLRRANALAATLAELGVRREF